MLEITEIRKFKITSESIFLFYFTFSITFGVLKFLRCISCTVSLRKSSKIAWLEINHGRDLAYTLLHNLDVAISSILMPRLLFLIPSWRNWIISLLDDILFFSLGAFVLSYYVLHTDTEH
jgi:hypothetical protein